MRAKDERLGSVGIMKKSNGGKYKIHNCDICGCAESVDVPHVQEYTNNETVSICVNCGFVYARRRRSFEDIAREWSDKIYNEKFADDHSTYSPRIPAVKARLTYVADYIDATIGLAGKKICDIGAGEGQFLEICRKDYGAKNVFGIEPSRHNTELLAKKEIESFTGSIEDFEKSKIFSEIKFDIVAIMWTLGNCTSCETMIRTANKMLNKGGHVVVAEGSRILVPFKKPMNYYFSKQPVDTHSFHFSINSLSNLFHKCNFSVKHNNRYIDTDYLCVIGRRSEKDIKKDMIKDNYLEVYDFFQRWHTETQMHYR